MALPRFLRIFWLNQAFHKVKYPQNTHKELFFLHFRIIPESNSYSQFWHLYQIFQKYRWNFSCYHRCCYLQELFRTCLKVHRTIWGLILPFAQSSSSFRGCYNYFNSILYIFWQPFHTDFKDTQVFLIQCFNFWILTCQSNLELLYENYSFQTQFFHFPCIISF